MYWQKKTPPRHGAEPEPSLPHLRSAGDIRLLLQELGPLLSPENRELLGQAADAVEQGGDTEALTKLASELRQKLQNGG